VKELNKDVARRAFKHAVVHDAPVMTYSPLDSPVSCRSMTPPLRPVCHASSSFCLDSQVDLPTRPLYDYPVSTQTAARVTDDQMTSAVGPPAARRAWILPVNGEGRTSPRRQAACRRAAPTLCDIDESLDPDTTAVHSLYQPHPIIAWASVDDDEVAPGGGNNVEVQTRPTTGKPQQPTQSNPSVSLDHPHPAAIRTVAAAAVQSEFVLPTTTTRHLAATPTCPREAVCMMRAEGDGTTSGVCCPMNSTVRSRPGEPVDMVGDWCQTKASSKKNDDIFAAGVDSNKATNNNLMCYRVQQDNNNASGVTNGQTDRLPSHNSADSVDVARETMTSPTAGGGGGQSQTPTTLSPAQSRDQRVANKQQVRSSAEMASSQQQQSAANIGGAAGKNKARCVSTPDSARLLAELIGKISELATRQDHLERVTSKPQQATSSDKGNQTDDQRRAAGGEPATSQMRLPATQNQQIPPTVSESVVGRQDERPPKQARKQRNSVESRRESAAEPVTSKTVPDDAAQQSTVSAASERQASNSGVPDPDEQRSTVRAVSQENANEPTKLDSSSRQGQRDGGQQRPPPPPAQRVQSTPRSAITDNIIHIVRGSSALDDLTVQDLVRQYCEPYQSTPEQPRTSYPVDGRRTSSRTETVMAVTDIQPPPGESRSPATVASQLADHNPPGTVPDDRPHSPRQPDEFQGPADDVNRTWIAEDLPDPDPDITRVTEQASRPRYEPDTVQDYTLTSSHLVRDRETAQNERRTSSNKRLPQTVTKTADDYCNQLKLQYVRCDKSRSSLAKSDITRLTMSYAREILSISSSYSRREVGLFVGVVHLGPPFWGREVVGGHRWYRLKEWFPLVYRPSVVIIALSLTIRPQFSIDCIRR